MNQANLFDPSEINPGNISQCRYPDKIGLTGYSYGCRCVECRKAKSRANHRAHRTGSTLPTCAEPGCTNPRRRVQGAKYCLDHATALGYTVTGVVHKPMRTCEVCGTQHRTGGVTRPFCPLCNEKYRGIINSARAHRAPMELLLHWIASASCDLCKRPVYLGKRAAPGHTPDGPVIDHAHTCCEGRRSCGSCIRGMLCNGCNMALGAVERLVTQSGWDAVTSYLVVTAG